MSEINIDTFGGRKYFLVLLTFIITTALVITGQVKQDDFLSIVQFIIIAYIGGNVGQSFFVKRAEEPDTVVNEQTDITLSDQFGGRKYNLMLLIFLTVAGLTYYSKVDSSVYVKIAGWLLGIYITGNIVKKAIDNKTT